MSRKVGHAIAAFLVFTFVSAGIANGTSINNPAGDTLPAAVEPNPNTPVVLVILDELPTSTLMKADETIDARRFPTFARLATESTWYRDHASAGDYTAWAVPPILTGNHSNDETLPTNAVQPNNIFNLLGPGRRVHAMEEVTELCSKKWCPDGHQGEARKEVLSSEFIKNKFKLVDMGEVFDWVKTIPKGSHALSMIHLPLPHQPQRFLPDGTTYPGGPVGFTIPEVNGWTISDAGISLVQQRHILQAAYADKVLGRILDRVRSNGDWDRSMVIVTADHGYSFDTRYDRRDVAPGNIAATVNPPLFIKYPGQETGEVSPLSTQAIDILPTINQYLGVTNAYPMEGIPISEVPETRDMLVDKDVMAEITINTSQIRNQRPQLIEASQERFGTGSLWTLGPDNQLIGTRPGRRNRLPDADLKIDNPERLADVNPDSDRLPSLISGVVKGVGGDRTVALALNGKITGTTRTFRYKGAMRFGSMARPSSFRKGRNRVAVYLVGAGDRLHRIR